MSQAGEIRTVPTESQILRIELGHPSHKGGQLHLLRIAKRRRHHYMIKRRQKSPVPASQAKGSPHARPAFRKEDQATLNHGNQTSTVDDDVRGRGQSYSMWWRFQRRRIPSARHVETAQRFAPRASPRWLKGAIPVATVFSFWEMRRRYALSIKALNFVAPESRLV